MRARGLARIQARNCTVRANSMASQGDEGGVQMGYMYGEHCLLLDHEDRVIGHDSKLNCHLTDHEVRRCIFLATTDGSDR